MWASAPFRSWSSMESGSSRTSLAADCYSMSYISGSVFLATDPAAPLQSSVGTPAKPCPCFFIGIGLPTEIA